MIDEILITEVRQIVDCLVRRDFRSLENDGRIGRVTVEDLARVLDAYGGTFVQIPDSEWSLAEAYDIEGKPNTWLVDVPLWTKEEGMSDLTLSLWVEKSRNDDVVGSINDLRAL